MRIIKTIPHILSATLLALGALCTGLFPDEVFANSSPQPEQIECAFSPHLSCRNPANDEVLWQAPHFDDPTPFSLAEGKLIISHGKHTFSYGQKNGELLWRVETRSKARYFYPHVFASMVYLARSDGVLEKRQLASGDLIWSHKLADGWVYPPVVTQNAIVTGGQDPVLLVVDPVNGNIRSLLEIDQQLVTPLFQQGEQIVAASFNKTLSAYHLAPGGRSLVSSWNLRLAAPVFSYIPDRNRILVADMGGSLSSIDLRRGEILWTRKIHENTRFWNLLTEQGLISLTNNGTLTLLDTTSGKVLGKHQFEQQFRRAPVMHEDDITLYDIHGVSQKLKVDQLKLPLTSIHYTSNIARNIK